VFECAVHRRRSLRRFAQCGLGVVWSYWPCTRIRSSGTLRQ
jgi:hypothetical protein